VEKSNRKPKPAPNCQNGAPLRLRVGEFDDSALMKAFSRQGRAYCLALAVLAKEVAAVYGLQEIGRIDSLR